MTFKIAFCAGHGGNNSTPGKRSPDGEYEWNFNNEVAVAFEDALKQYEGVELLRTDDRTGKTDVPLQTRTDKANAWKADIYISFHHNANTSKWGNWTGTESFTYLGHWPDAERLDSLVHPKILKAYGLADRGMKKADFHIVRETKMPAILIEGGFMDSTTDIKKLRDHDVLHAAGVAVAEGVAEYAGLKKKVVPTSAKVSSNQIGVVTANVHTVVRKGPGVPFDIVKTIEKGQAFKCYGRTGDWYNVGAGWVYSRVVTFKK